jgi:hypothetical protein
MQSKTQIKSIGIDLGKTTFHLVALGPCASGPSEILRLGRKGISARDRVPPRRIGP